MEDKKIIELDYEGALLVYTGLVLFVRSNDLSVTEKGANKAKAICIELQNKFEQLPKVFKQ